MRREHVLRHKARAQHVGGHQPLDNELGLEEVLAVLGKALWAGGRHGERRHPARAPAPTRPCRASPCRARGGLGSLRDARAAKTGCPEQRQDWPQEEPLQAPKASARMAATSSGFVPKGLPPPRPAPPRPSKVGHRPGRPLSLPGAGTRVLGGFAQRWQQRQGTAWGRRWPGGHPQGPQCKEHPGQGQPAPRHG